MQIEEKPKFATPFEWIGGEVRVKALAERFYDLMDLEPGYSALRAAAKLVSDPNNSPANRRRAHRHQRA